MNQIQTTVLGYPVNTRGPWHVSKSQLAAHNLNQWLTANHGQPDYWLRELICRAFQRMKPRNMDGAPGADDIVMVSEEWVEIIGEGMDESDRDRVIIAFRAIFRECRKWPQPADLIKRLPTRIKRNPAATVMEAPMSDEQHAKGSAAFDDILAALNKD